MKNFPPGSFLKVKLPKILFIGKVRKTRTTARYNCMVFLNSGPEDRLNVRLVDRRGGDARLTRRTR